MAFKKIIIADDHPIVRLGIESFVKKFNAEIDVAFASSLEELQFVLLEGKNDLLIQDVYFGDKDARDFIEGIIEKFQIPVIALSTDDNPNLVNTILAKGAKAFVSKSENLDELVEALHAVESGETYISSDIQRKLTKYEQDWQQIRLTKRELEVLHEAVKEKTNKEIATALFITEKTVEIHKTNLYSKLGVKNMAGLVKRAFELNLIRK
ncbi:MAG: response regulator transcription factor [Flavobacteriales bacterium]